MAKMKLDVKQLQKLLIEKAEYLGLGVAGLLLVLCFGYSIMALFGPKSLADDIKKEVGNLQGKIAASAPPEDKGGKTVFGSPTWDHPVKSDQYASSSWFDGSGTASNKREKPAPLAMDKKTQVDYVGSGVPIYEVDRDAKVLRLPAPGRQGESDQGRGKRSLGRRPNSSVAADVPDRRLGNLSL